MLKLKKESNYKIMIENKIDLKIKSIKSINFT